MIKYGGNAMKNTDIKTRILEDIAEVHRAGHRVILVHGGGPFINNLLDRLCITSKFVGGHRKTTTEAIKYIEMALTGDVNADLVRSLQLYGINAVGLSGKDGQLVVARKKYHKDGDSQVDLGWVGEVAKVNPNLLQTLTQAGFFPVLTCMASGEDGHAYNINGDMFAGHIAGALKADLYIVLTDVDGLCIERTDPSTLISQLKLTDIPKLIGSVISGGMIPKIDSCEVALREGAREVRIVNGTKPGILRRLIVHQENIGTSITS